MCKNSRNVILFSLALIVIIVTLPINTFANEIEKRKVKIGCAVTVGYHQLDEEGNVCGYGYDYENILAQYANWDIEYVQGTWSELNNKLENGEIDMLGFLVKTPEREEIYDFADSPAGVSKSNLVTLESNTQYNYEDYDSFDGMVVGYQVKNANVNSFLEWCTEHEFTVQLKQFASVAEVCHAMDLGLIDATLVTNFNQMSQYKVIARMLPQNIYYAVTKGNKDLLNELNNAMEDVLLYYPSLSNKLYDTYYNERSGYHIAFSNKEQEYLDTNPFVTVFPGSREKPYEYYDEESGTYKGIIPDVLERISKLTGITFQYVHTTDRWNYKSSEATGNKITCFSADLVWAQKNDLMITQPFIDSDISIITKDAQTKINKIAVVPNRYISDHVERLYPDCQIQYFDTIAECYAAILNGKCDATFVNSLVADYYFTIGRYSILHEEICKEFTQDICFGITYDSNPYLINILSKALLMISTEEYSTIEKENINENRDMGFWDLIYTNPNQLVVVILIMVILSILALAFVLKTRKAYQIIQDMSVKDMVTGVYNRCAFEQKLQREYNKAAKKVTCIFIDANGLHEINNKKGHHFGDLLLKKIADTLKEDFTQEDVFRMGGDEFVLICMNQEEMLIKQKMMAVIQKLENSEISISFGVKYMDIIENAIAMEELVKAADNEMLKQKKEYYQTHDRRARE